MQSLITRENNTKASFRTMIVFIIIQLVHAIYSTIIKFIFNVDVKSERLYYPTNRLINIKNKLDFILH